MEEGEGEILCKLLNNTNSQLDLNVGGVGGMILTCEMDRNFWPGNVKKRRYEISKALSKTVPEGSRKLSFPNFTTMAQDGGKVVSLTHRPHLPPGNTPGTHFC